MKGLNRRDFLKLCAGSAAAVSLAEVLLPHLLEAAPASGNPPVLWITGAACSGCGVSLLNSEQPAIAQILTEVISLKFMPTISGASGYLSESVIDETYNAGGYFLVVEGAIPTGANGLYCTVGVNPDGSPITFMDRVDKLARKATAVLAFGTCSSFGGIPAANPNPTGCMGSAGLFQDEGNHYPGDQRFRLSAASGLDGRQPGLLPALQVAAAYGPVQPCHHVLW